MSMWTAKEKSLNYDQAKAEAARAQKDIKMVKQFVQTTVFQFTEYVITTLVKWTDRFLNIFMIKVDIVGHIFLRGTNIEWSSNIILRRLP